MKEVKKEETPEEIQKWIEERKKKFPRQDREPLTEKSTDDDFPKSKKQALDEFLTKEDIPIKKPCKYFAQGKCKNGRKCNYSHIAVNTKNRPSKGIHHKV